MHLAAVLDLWSRKVIGFALGEEQGTNLAMKALNRALRSRDIQEGLIHHSDRGMQYRSREYLEMLIKNGILASFGKRGECWDNAVAESFFHTLKTEYVYCEKFQTRVDAIQGVKEWIKKFYNLRRRHSTLGYLSPEEYERSSMVS